MKNPDTATTKTTSMTATEVAAHFNVTPQSVRKWARQGRVPAFRLGTLLRFDLTEVEEALRLRGTDDDCE